jgi:hypothetical protein
MLYAKKNGVIGVGRWLPFCLLPSAFHVLDQRGRR